MPHQCVKCNKVFKENSEEILKGCSTCGGKFFFFVKSGGEKKLEEVSSKLSLSDKEKIEKDVLDILGDSETDKPIILDLASISVLNPGKFELDLSRLFKKEPLVYMLDEGKYIIDVATTFTNFKDKKEETNPS